MEPERRLNYHVEGRRKVVVMAHVAEFVVENRLKLLRGKPLFHPCRDRHQRLLKHTKYRGFQQRRGRAYRNAESRARWRGFP